MSSIASVTLPCGRAALFDQEDAQLVAGHNWRAQPVHGGRFYAVYTLNRKPLNPILIRMHRVIIRAGRQYLVDHRDGNGLNNTRGNLRIATRSQNGQNRSKRTGAVKFKGVWPDGNKYRARIVIGGRRLYLGSFDTEEYAALAYDAAARESFGEFARLNFPICSEMGALITGETE